MQMFGWMIADPVCSIFIAVLIALSVGSLVADSMAILMQRSPKELDHSLPEVYQKVMQPPGYEESPTEVERGETGCQSIS